MLETLRGGVLGEVLKSLGYAFKEEHGSIAFSFSFSLACEDPPGTGGYHTLRMACPKQYNVGNQPWAETSEVPVTIAFLLQLVASDTHYDNGQLTDTCWVIGCLWSSHVS